MRHMVVEVRERFAEVKFIWGNKVSVLFGYELFTPNLHPKLPLFHYFLLALFICPDVFYFQVAQYLYFLND
jgi:hypothetical protein